MPTEKKGLKILVGELWPDGIEIWVKPISPKGPKDPRNAVILGTATGLGVLLVVFTIYGMMYSDTMLNKIFDLVIDGLSLLLAFVFGQFTAKSRSP
jgi:hypothetical protein